MFINTACMGEWGLIVCRLQTSLLKLAGSASITVNIVQGSSCDNAVGTEEWHRFRLMHWFFLS